MVQPLGRDSWLRGERGCPRTEGGAFQEKGNPPVRGVGCSAKKKTFQREGMKKTGENFTQSFRSGTVP